MQVTLLLYIIIIVTVCYYHSVMSSHTSTNPCFFYGTLMSKSVLMRVIAPKSNLDSIRSRLEALDFKLAILKGYKRLQVKGEPYPGMILGSAEDIVEGTYVSGLTDGEMLRLDQFEGIVRKLAS